MKLKNYVYEIYRTNEANQGTDVVNVGYPMFLEDVSNGERKYCPVPLDFSAIRKDYMAMTSEARAQENHDFIQWLGKHVGDLGELYPDRDAMLAFANATEYGE